MSSVLRETAPVNEFTDSTPPVVSWTQLPAKVYGRAAKTSSIYKSVEMYLSPTIGVKPG